MGPLKGRFEMTLRSDGTTQSETCGRPLARSALSMTQTHIQLMLWLRRQNPRGSLSFQLRFLKAGPSAVLQPVIGLARTGSRDAEAWSCVGGRDASLLQLGRQKRSLLLLFNEK